MQINADKHLSPEPWQVVNINDPITYLKPSRVGPGIFVQVLHFKHAGNLQLKKNVSSYKC